MAINAQQMQFKDASDHWMTVQVFRGDKEIKLGSLHKDLKTQLLTYAIARYGARDPSSGAEATFTVRLEEQTPGLKPVIQAIQGLADRQFNGSAERTQPSSTPRTQPTDAPAGIPNVGGTCYAGALFQIIALHHKEKLEALLKNKSPKSRLDTKERVLQKELADLYEDYKAGRMVRREKMERFMDAVSALSGGTYKREWADSVEFYRFLLKKGVLHDGDDAEPSLVVEGIESKAKLEEHQNLIKPGQQSFVVHPTQPWVSRTVTMNGIKYSLQGAVLFENDHYTAYIQKNGKHWFVNDSTSREWRDPADEQDKTPRLLYYVRVDETA